MCSVLVLVASLLRLFLVCSYQAVRLSAVRLSMAGIISVLVRIYA